MVRPLRLECTDAVYHVTSRGDRQDAIYRDDADRKRWLEMFDTMCLRHNLIIYSYCEMTNHYHLLLETPEANLSRAMRDLNGAYTQYFNRRHKVVGHLFQGRYKAILVQKQTYLLELIRYIALNPVRAQLVCSADDWRWSSHYLALHGRHLPSWLDQQWIWAQFSQDTAAARAVYTDFVRAGSGRPSPLRAMRHQLLLGDEAFCARYLAHPEPPAPFEVARSQRRSMALSLPEYELRYPDRNEAIVHAYLSTVYSMREIAAHFGISYKTVSRIIHHPKAEADSCTNERSDPDGLHDGLQA
ncbi:transposase [Oxalobacteraceae bacterium A2-2]